MNANEQAQLLEFDNVIQRLGSTQWKAVPTHSSMWGVQSQQDDSMILIDLPEEEAKLFVDLRNAFPAFHSHIADLTKERDEAVRDAKKWRSNENRLYLAMERNLDVDKLQKIYHEARNEQ